jgi:hypothetical protein
METANKHLESCNGASYDDAAVAKQFQVPIYAVKSDPKPCGSRREKVSRTGSRRVAGI